MIELRSNVPFDTRSVVLKTIFPANRFGDVASSVAVGRSIPPVLNVLRTVGDS